jgi:hypothetical protein
LNNDELYVSGPIASTPALLKKPVLTGFTSNIASESVNLQSPSLSLSTLIVLIAQLLLLALIAVLEPVLGSGQTLKRFYLTGSYA